MTITIWYDNCKAPGRKAPQSEVSTAQYITGVKLPAIQDVAKSCTEPSLCAAFTVRCHFKSASAVRKEDIKIALPALWEVVLGWRGSLIVCAMLQMSYLF